MLEPRLIFNLLTKEQYIFRDIRYEKYFELLWMAKFPEGKEMVKLMVNKDLELSLVGLFLFFDREGRWRERGSEGGHLLQVIFTEHVPF